MSLAVGSKKDKLQKYLEENEIFINDFPPFGIKNKFICQRVKNHTPPIFYHSLACTRKHPIITVNTSYQFNKSSCKAHRITTVTYNENKFGQFIVPKHHKNPQKLSQTFKITQTKHFVPKHFSNKLTKTPLGGYLRIIWLNAYIFMLSCSETSLIKKQITEKILDCSANWKRKKEIQGERI